MNNQETQLANIKKVLQGYRTNLAFRYIIAKLDTWEGEGIEKAYKLCEEEFKNWEPYYRIAPWSWKAGLVDDEAKPFWKFVSYIQGDPYRFYHECYDDGTYIRVSENIDKKIKSVPVIYGNKYYEKYRSLIKKDSILVKENFDKKASYISLFKKERFKNAKKIEFENFNELYPKCLEYLITSLIETKIIENLESLKFRSFSGHRSSLQAISLLSSAKVEKLQELSLSFSLPDEYKKSIKILSEANFPNLKNIDLSGGDLGDDGVLQLLNSSWIKRVEYIDLSYNEITQKGIEYLVKSNLPNLKQLNVSSNNISTQGIQTLIHSNLAKNLWSLEINNNPYVDCKVDNNKFNIELLLNEITISGMNNLVELKMCNHYTIKYEKLPTTLAQKIATSSSFVLLDTLFVGYIDWRDACDGHGPLPCSLFDEEGLNIIKESKALRSSAKNELYILSTFGNKNQNDDEYNDNDEDEDIE